MDASSNSTMWKAGIACEPAAAQPAHQLQQATRIGRDDGLCLGGEQIFYLAIAQLIRGLGVEQVVDPGRAAAQRGLLDLRDFEAWNGSQQASRLGVDALSVPQVARVMIRHPHRQSVARRARGQFAQNL